VLALKLIPTDAIDQAKKVWSLEGSKGLFNSACLTKGKHLKSDAFSHFNCQF
jgi:hypothetical protein